MSDESDQSLKVAVCSSCGYTYPEAKAIGSKKPEDREPCHDCGSKAVTFQVQIADTVTLRSMLGLKSKHSGDKKPFVETKTGDDLHRRTGRWSKLFRHIDRENDHYQEKITDAETGEIIHESDEPLSKHWGHGSAKNKTQSGLAEATDLPEVGEAP